jgi:hypothetical protein
MKFTTLAILAAAIATPALAAGSYGDTDTSATTANTAPTTTTDSAPNVDPAVAAQDHDLRVGPHGPAASGNSQHPACAYRASGGGICSQ